MHHHPSAVSPSDVRPSPSLFSRSSRRLPPLAMAAACVKAASAAGVARHHATEHPARTRMRVAMGWTDDYDYEDDCRLGEGSFGSVIRARHRATGQAVAIKRLTDAGGNEELLRESLLLEAASAGNPFVVGCRGLVRDPATFDLCLVMDCGGASLRDALRRQPGPLPEDTVRKAMWMLLTGAKGMHGAHIMHRDIKPHNILLGDDETLRFCDFGLAVDMAAEPPPYGKAGTRWYMAPEVLLGKPDYDARVEVWSLGCVMAQLVTGEAPFQSVDDEDQLRAIFGVLGVPDDAGWPWPWLWSTQFATELDKQRCNESVLRRKFPETKLSKEGLDLLSGLLTCNPNKRLTTAAALKHPWFSKMD
ncbi:unnamed protein product [Urochloa decumbens]|uniref:[RNA-polymerase]-subunit kinase n=1 Tax=Urochloa decumbens TaxID=240449 RepID=A0ABC8YG67_9POAL